MRDLLVHPASREEDLGFPLPESPHACSVCLPTWSSVIGYEEGRDKVMRRLRAGYPRFCRNPILERLTVEATKELCSGSEELFLFPTKDGAQRAQRWIERHGKEAARSSAFRGLQAIIVSKKAAPLAIEYQRLTGELVSSRMAEDLLNGGLLTGTKRHLLQRRLATIYGGEQTHVSVFGSGMSAVTAVMRSLQSLARGRKTLQLEFPYVDSLKVQERIGNGVVFLNETEGESFDEALSRIRQGEFAAVFTEVPSNPLLRCPDLPRVSEACREGGTPLVVDDSSVGPSNVNVLPWADVVTGSLTKWLSGAGDVMGGVVIVRSDSEFAGELNAPIRQESEKTAPMYVGDAQVMLSNLKGYPARMDGPNATALRLVEMLVEHPAVAQVWHPSVTHRERYEKVKAAKGGFGPLFSFLLKTPKKTPKFFDALNVSKGPSFGTNFTLASPYVMLAHYRELDWAEGCGISRHLIRVSCGQEDAENLERIFKEALQLA
ncbi:PLP-dependent transferase [Haloferula sp.]|uniref:PLP-dependent transferase n=1 Tax=Haloferula sp. TaxID=2497595 RepID=UPI0032A078B0